MPAFKTPKFIVSLSILVILYATPANGQDFICSDSVYGVFSPFAELIGFENDNLCQDSLLVENITIHKAFDITVFPDSTAYGFGMNNGFLDTLFFKISYISGLSIYPNAITIDRQIQGLTCDETGYYFGAGKGITKQHPVSAMYNEQYLGNLPPNMRCQGDMTYRQGKFYLASIENKLVEVNMKNPGLSKVVMDFPPGTLPIHGMTTVQIDCDSVITYAMGRGVDSSTIYTIDFDNWTIAKVCDVPFSITGAGAHTECQLPPCNLFLDLDTDNSSFGFRGNFCADTFCIPPVSVTDTDVVILSAPGYIDSLTFELRDVLDGPAEYLQAGAVQNIFVTGNATSYLTLINDGNATIADFENAIRTIQYYNDQVPVTYGMRQVWATAFADGESSLVSIAELPLSNDALKLVPDITLPDCHGQSSGSILVSASGGTAPYSFDWATGFNGTGLNDLNAGVYPVTITDATGCAKPDTVVLDEPDSLWVSVSYTGFPAVCNESGALEASASGGTSPYIYTWNNGTTGNLNENIGAGDYTVAVTDANGCEATASYQVLEGDTVLVTEKAEICEGASYQWAGNTYTTSTSECQVFTLPNGCDSTHCLELTVHPLPVIQLTASGDLCEADQITISTNLQASYSWNTGASTQEIVITDPGQYTVTATNVSGCTASASIQIESGFTLDWYAESPACFGQDNGRIVIENSMGGIPPILYSIDGTNFTTETLFDNLPPGDYLLIAEDAAGCRKEITILLEAPPGLYADAGDDQTVRLGENVTLSVTTNVTDPTVSWQPPDFLDCDDCQSVTAQPLRDITYEVTVYDSNGCVVSDFVTVQVDKQPGIYIPNAFSPNGDGVNDVFTLFSDSSVSRINYLRVFDRWGGLVFGNTGFLPNTLSSGWDGGDIPAGVFVYVTEVEFVDGRREVLSGEVVLIR